MEIDEEFRQRVRTEICGKLNDVTFDLIYNYAWEEGHAYGRPEVESYLCDLTDMAVKIVRANRTIG